MSQEKTKLSRADRKQIESAIARAKNTDKRHKSAQDSIPFQRMFPDGICRVTDNYYSKTVQFQDINYQLNQNEDKTAIFDSWCDFLNYFDSSIHFQLSFVNLAANKAMPGQTFAEVFACAPGAVLNVSVEAESAVTVMFLRVRRVLSVCPSACSHHSRIIRNLLGELAEKNLRLNEKLTHMGQRTTRAKLMSYFSAEAQRRGGYEFDIPFSRQQLADYLGVERSGLSLELGKMRREGLLDFHKSHFLLKTPEADSLSPSAR